MAVNNKKLYKFHVKNIRSIEIALRNSALAARSAIAEQNDPAIRSFVSLNAFLLGAWAENRLRKLLYEYPGLTDQERNSIVAKASQIERWQKLIEVAFRRHYNVPTAALNDTNLPFSASARYRILAEILDQDLRSVIEIRNKLAHGQWVYPLNSNENDIEQEKYQLLSQENLPSLQYKKSLLTSLSEIIHDLVVSLGTFERDFDQNFKRISQTRNNLKNRKYQKYATNLVEKRRRGIETRKLHNKLVNSETKKPSSFLARLLRPVTDALCGLRRN